nr:hypothetical protein [uncultured Caproiciproducens sp.]
MKKIISVLLSLAVIVMSAPVAVQAATQDAGIVDKHGAKTYLGTASDWGTTWDEDNFTEVTDKDVTFPGNLTIKAGEVKDISVSGSNSKLTITSGTMDDIDCDGTVDVTAGTIGSIESNGDMALKGGTIKRNAQSYQKVTISGKVTVGGSVIGQDVVSLGNTGATISGSLQAGNTITLTGNALKAKEINGESTAELDIKGYKGKLPTIVDMSSIVVDGSSSVTANGNVVAGNLTIQQKGEFVTTSLLELYTLTGPGTLSFNAGKLTIHNGITGKPLLNFNNAVKSGVTAFKADNGMVREDDVRLYDYELNRESNDDYDKFVLTGAMKEGITLNKSSLAVDGKTQGSVVASVKPSFSEFAAGTKLVWELHGETSAFTISSSGLTCKVSANSSLTGSYKATLVAYLVDGKGDRLTDYKSDSCILSCGTSSGTQDQPDSGMTLDTYTVTIGAGSTYWVLADTNSKTAPVPMSYNSSVATVGAAAAYNKNGKIGWIYPVTGVAKGEVTIDIGGQKMITTIAAGSIVVDTASYTMNSGGKYYIGVKISGIDRNNLNVHSQNACTTVQYAGKNKSGLDLYVVAAGQTGVGAVVFEIIGGQSVQTQITVQSGVQPHGVSGRLIAAA